MTDPETFRFEQVRAAYEALGLDPARLHSTRSIHIQPGEVEVVRYHQLDGHSHIVEGTNATHTESFTLRLIDGPVEHELA